MYKMSYYRFGETRTSYNHPAGFDRTRGYVIGKKDITLDYIEEAYTTENWLVRIYKVITLLLLLKPYLFSLKTYQTDRLLSQKTDIFRRLRKALAPQRKAEQNGEC